MEGNHYLEFNIIRVEVNLNSYKHTPYCLISIKDKKVLTAADKKGIWDVNLSHGVDDVKELKNTEVKIALYSKDNWKKEKFLGEANVSLASLMQTKTQDPSNGSDLMYEMVAYNDKKKKKKEDEKYMIPVVKLYFNFHGWKYVLDLIGTKENIGPIIKTLIGTADKKNKQIRSYINKNILSQLQRMLVDDSTSLDLKTDIVTFWTKISKKDDEMLLLLVKEDFLQLIADSLKSVKEEDIQVQLLELLKSFFKYVSHQQLIVQLGILKRIIEFISKGSSKLQTKSFEVLMNFDVEHQRYMIDQGILQHLSELLFVDNVPLQTRVLAVIQYFDVSHQDQMVRQGMLAHILKLIGSEKQALQSKALSVVQHFAIKYKNDLISYGILKQLVFLFKDRDSISLRLKSLEVIKSFVDTYQEKLVEEGILANLIEALEDPSLQIRLECLNIIMLFDKIHSIPAGILNQIRDVIQGPNEELQLKALNFVLSLDEKYQEELKEVGILALLTDMLAPTQEEETKLDSVAAQIDNEPSVQLEEPKVEGALEYLDFLIDTLATHGTIQMTKWSCEACTFLNDPTVAVCSICSSERPTPPSNPPPVQTAETTNVNNNNNIEPQPSQEPWTCVACTFVNENWQATLCEICGTVRPPPEIPSPEMTPSQTPPPPPPSADPATEPTSPPAEEQKESLVTTSSKEVSQNANETEKTLSNKLKSLILEVLRSFNVKYQTDMIERGLIRSLKILLANSDLQNEIVRTISYFEEVHHSEMIKDGLISRFLQLITPKNAKVFLLLIQQFEGYQQELIQKKFILPIVKLLSIDDIQLQSRVSDFFLNFDEMYWKDISTVLNTALASEGLGPRSVCDSCGGIGAHLTTCKAPKLDIVLKAQISTLLWQIGFQGIRPLNYNIVYCDGGEHSKKYRVKNLLSPNDTVYSSKPVQVVNIVFQYEGNGVPFLTHVIIKAPRSKFDSPVQTAAVWVSEKTPDLKGSKKYDALKPLEWADIQSKKGTNDPLLYLELNTRNYAEAALYTATKANFVHLKLLTAQSANFDVEYVGLVGITLPEGRPTSSIVIDPLSVSDVGSSLGVKRRVKRFVPQSDFDENGLLYWLGTYEGEKLVWTNPLLTSQISVTTSHPMYAFSMKVEDIVNRDGGTSCYWGSSSPQYFIVDLKTRLLRCSHFTLRHGYQAPNSYIQNWTFSCSNDLIHWVTLYEGAETPFNKAFDTKTWLVNHTPRDFYRYFRVLQKGNYSMGRGTTTVGSPYLCISGFELYGDLLMD